jgi:hypothetical protein
MPVKINGISIAPAPMVTMSKTYVSSPGVGVIGADYSINLNGTLIAYKGNPQASGTTPSTSLSTSSVYDSYSTDDPIINLSPDALLNSIMKKQDYLRHLVASGQSTGLPLLLEIVGYNENKGIKAYCDVSEISFDDQSRWTNTCGYTIGLKTASLNESANGLALESLSNVSSAEDSWSFQESNFTVGSTFEVQAKTFTVSRSCSAVGLRVFQSGVVVPPIQTAINYVQNSMGLGGGIPTFDYLPIGDAVNHKVTENRNDYTGSYSVTEEYTLVPGSATATEVVTVSVESDLSSLVKVSINGTITGLDTNSAESAETTRAANAESYWSSLNLYSRVETYATDLNEIPISQSVGRNFTEGTISYSYAYDTRPVNLITGALAEDIQVSDTYPGQLINVVPVIGRSQPIIQYLNSRSEYKRSLQISANMPFVDGVAVKPPTGDLNAIFNLYKPDGDKVYYEAPQETFNYKTGQYSYSVSWTFEA